MQVAAVLQSINQHRGAAGIMKPHAWHHCVTLTSAAARCRGFIMKAWLAPWITEVIPHLHNADSGRAVRSVWLFTVLRHRSNLCVTVGGNTAM